MTVEERIAGAFDRRGAAALFVSEIEHDLDMTLEPAAFAAALRRLLEHGDIIIVTKPAPDPHVADADLRIVARAAPGAHAAIDAAWNAWLREFFSSHRCS